ncbi:MAG: hypothetical protein U9P71_00145 [Campylobacterota bacterium]|nr:hypothetical protein [Campylobacterota bacterium]
MASVGALGSTIHTNQLTAAVASEKTALQNKFELQNMAAANASNESKKEIEEIRPTEENHMVDEDREHTNQHAKEENPKEKPEDEGEEEAAAPLHRLDIKV